MLLTLFVAGAVAKVGDQPSFLFILGDDIGWADFSYNNGQLRLRLLLRLWMFIAERDYTFTIPWWSRNGSLTTHQGVGVDSWDNQNARFSYRQNGGNVCYYHSTGKAPYLPAHLKAWMNQHNLLSYFTNCRRDSLFPHSRHRWVFRLSTSQLHIYFIS